MARPLQAETKTGGLNPLVAFSLASLVFLPACSTDTSSPGLTPLPVTVTDQEPARKALRTAEASFSKLAMKSGLAEAFYQFLAPGGTVLLPDASPLDGREVVRIHLAASQQTVLDWQPGRAEISQNGDLGYTWGTFEMRGQVMDGKIQNTYGKYVSLWKKQADGTWRIVLHSNNSSPPPKTRR